MTAATNFVNMTCLWLHHRATTNVPPYPALHVCSYRVACGGPATLHKHPDRQAQITALTVSGQCLPFRSAADECLDSHETSARSSQLTAMLHHHYAN